jgi:Ca2+-dependent lipid-binding protein
MGLPRISISVVAMAKALPNIMDIPLLSSFIASSIDTAVAEYVAPKGITLDLQQLISGDDIKKGQALRKCLQYFEKLILR